MQDPINNGGSGEAGAPQGAAAAQASMVSQASVASGSALQAAFNLTDEALTVHVRIVNTSDTPWLVFDKLWDLDRASKLTPDAQAIYRFVDGGTLRLLLGIAPPPTAKSVLYRNVPYVTRVEAHATLEYDVTVSTPVREHNVYFPPPNDEAFTAESATSVELFVQYLVATPDIKATPSPFIAGALTLATPGVWDSAQTLRSGVTSLNVPTLRRTDTFSRWPNTARK